MTVAATRVSAAALVLALTSQGAWADITAKQAWDELKNYMTLSGYEVSGTEAMSGNTLTISDTKLTFALPEDSGSVLMDMSTVTFVENGDGSVNVTFPEVIPMTTQGDIAEEAQMSVAYHLKDTETRMSGTVDNMVIDTKAGELSMRMDIAADGEEDADINVTVTNVAGQTKIAKGDLTTYTQNMTMDSLSYLMDINDPSVDTKASLNGTLTNVTWDGDGTFPKSASQPVDVAQMLNSGLTGKGVIGFKSSTGSMSGTGEDGDFAMQSTSGGGTFNFAMDASKMSLDGTQTDASITVQSAQIPFPVSMQWAEYSAGISFPVTKSDEEQPFAFHLTLGDFTIADQLWGMIDPSGKLPRDPANLKLDLTGKAKLFFDLFNQAEMAGIETGETKPGELNSVSVKELLLSFVGAELTGTGEFAFDNAGPVPAPSGEADLKLVGANKLIDTLIDMGLLPAEQAMGARMMMGVFAVPGDGEDTLVSKIELGKDGSISANGQRIK